MKHLISGGKHKNEQNVSFYDNYCTSGNDTPVTWELDELKLLIFKPNFVL